ncbi:MAG: hypothetical protein IJN50_04360 [Clostridia bacterium]|nr:hypothetical protein [Clostridia bacterium]
MKIGIDIDNVISNMDDTLLKEYLKHDKELRGTGIINHNPYNVRCGMFDCSKEEEETFYKENIERMAKNFRPLNGAKRIIDKLKSEGNDIYIISGRDNGEYSEPREMTVEWLKKYEINYDELILTNAYDKHAKTIECKRNKIDIMIEDNIATCQDLKENGIKVLLMNTRYNQENKDLERALSWDDIYSKISKSY